MSSERAIVIGGFSESPECIAPLTNEVATIFSDVEQLTWHQAFRRRNLLARDTLARTVITHSAGAMFLREGQRAIALSGPEPIHPAGAMLRAGLVALNMRHGDESEVSMTIRGSVEEILRHPDHLRILGKVARFSTAERLILKGSERFPDGRFYLPSQEDEFGFTRPEMMERAAAHGITAAYVGRFHNYPLTNPKATVAQIHQLLEAPSVAA